VSLPGWASSIRARLTALSSLVLFGLMALVLALVYLDVQADIADAPVTSDLKIAGKKFDGSRLRVEEAGDLRRFEQVVNDRTLDTLRGAALVSLGALGLLSLGVGWVLSGRALGRWRGSPTSRADRGERPHPSHRAARSGRRAQADG
jgi:hypothetical protein